MVAGLALALERWGTKPLAEALAPAIELARDGYPVGAYQLRFVRRLREPLTKRYPETARIQFPPADLAEPLGWRLVQAELADTLEDITGVHPFPKDVYYLDRIPAVVDAPDLAVVIGVTLLISFAAAQVPSIRAGRRDPVQAMRNG